MGSAIRAGGQRDGHAKHKALSEQGFVLNIGLLA
jgi:hypothetical protein